MPEHSLDFMGKLLWKKIQLQCASDGSMRRPVELTTRALRNSGEYPIQVQIVNGELGGKWRKTFTIFQNNKYLTPLTRLLRMKHLWFMLVSAYAMHDADDAQVRFAPFYNFPPFCALFPMLCVLTSVVLHLLVTNLTSDTLSFWLCHIV
jgi:hypothetical protein